MITQDGIFFPPFLSFFFNDICHQKYHDSEPLGAQVEATWTCLLTACAVGQQCATRAKLRRMMAI